MIRYAITAGAGSTEEILRSARRWAAERMDFVQLREKQLDAAELAVLARSMLAIFAEHRSRTRLLINSRVDIAVAASADGVHLTAHADELTPAQARSVFAAAGRPAPLVSISCHTLAEVARARDAGVDLILFGPVFEKRVAGELASAGTELGLLRAACATAGGAKVLALGGITTENSLACIEAGAAGVAGIRLFR